MNGPNIFYLTQYRHTSFYCTLFYCAAQVFLFFPFLFSSYKLKTSSSPAKRSQLALLQYLLYCSGLEPDRQSL